MSTARKYTLLNTPRSITVAIAMSVLESPSGSEPTTAKQPMDTGRLAQASAQSIFRPRVKATRNSGTQASIPQQRVPIAANSTRRVTTLLSLRAGGTAPWPYMTAPGPVIDVGFERIGPHRHAVPGCTEPLSC